MTASLGDENSASVLTDAPALLTPDAIRVLLIEDGVIDRGVLGNELARQGFAVRQLSALPAASGDTRNAHVIVLHSGGKTTGIDLLGRLKRLGADIPIVLLTGEAAPDDESRALDKGSLDVMDASHRRAVLVGRVKGIVKAFGRTASQVDGRIIAGRLILRPDVSRAYWKDADLGLTLGEYKLVHLMVSNAGRYVTYRAIYDRLHYEGFIAGSGGEGYRANVRTAIKRIRNKFRALDPTFDEIENYSGFGYCWKKPH